MIDIDLTKYAKHESSGLAKFVKTPKVVESKPFSEYFNMYDDITKGKEKVNLENIEAAQTKAGFFDENLIWSDFEKV